MERRYIKLRADELYTRADATKNWNELCAILEEFQFRTSKRSRQVYPLILEMKMKLFEELFKWPETAASGGNKSLGEKTVFRYHKGMLRTLGYRVGRTGLVRESRKRILDRVYKNPLPFVNSDAYLGEWGQPITGPRLRKLAETIAALCRNAKRNDSIRQDAAITDWEEDLAYLKKAYYDGRYDFAWPRTASWPI